MQENCESTDTPRVNLQNLINNTHLSPMLSSDREGRSHPFDITSELANLRQEFCNFKESITSKIHKDLGESEDCASLQNSYDRKTERNELTEDRLSTYRTGKFEDTGNNSTSRSQLSARDEVVYPVPPKDAILAIQEYETDCKTVSRNSQFEGDTISRYDEDQSADDRSMISYQDCNENGFISDVKLLLEGKPFVVLSRSNDIDHKRIDRDLANTTTYSDWSTVSASKPREANAIFQKYEEETRKANQQLSGLRKFQDEVQDLVKNITGITLGGSENMKPSQNEGPLSPYRLRKPKYKDLPVQKIETDSHTDIGDLFRKKIYSVLGQSAPANYQPDPQRLNLASSSLGNENEEDLNGTAGMLKKTLSVIFSTDESLESTSNQASRQNLLDDIPPSILLPVAKEIESISDNHDLKTNDSEKQLESKRSSNRETEKINQIVSSVPSTHSSVRSEDENFMSFMHMMRLQNKNNPELDARLSRLTDLYNAQIEKYEDKIQEMRIKNDKMAQSNEILIRTLKNCEKEIDNLANTNSVLHKSLMFFEEEIAKKDTKENELMRQIKIQREHMIEIKHDVETRYSEIDEMARKLVVSEAKINGLTTYTRSCEESICAINVALKKILHKGNFRFSNPTLFRVLESIVCETSKFVDRLESSCEADASKSNISRPTVSYESSDKGYDSSSSFERDSNPRSKPSPRVGPLEETNRHLFGNNGYLEQRSQKGSSRALSSSSRTPDGPSPNKEVKRSTSAISKKDRGREKENFVYHGKDGRKEKSAPNRDISPGNIGKSGVIVEEKVKDNLRRRLMNNLKSKNM